MTVTLPWFVVNAGSSLGLNFSAGVRDTFRLGSESDYALVIGNNLETLGLSAFPAVPLLSGALLVATLLLSRRLLRARDPAYGHGRSP